MNDIASKINNSYLKTLNAYLLENNSIPFKENSSTQNSIYNWLKRQLIKHDCFDGTLTKAQVCNLLKYLVATDTNG